MQTIFSPSRAKAARLASGLSQRQAAREIGCARQSLLNAESGESVPGGDLLARMADAYGVLLDDLFVHASEATSPAKSAKQPAGAA